MKTKFKKFIQENKWLLVTSCLLLVVINILILFLIGLIINFINNNLAVTKNISQSFVSACQLTKVWPILLITLIIYVLIIYKWWKHKKLVPELKETESKHKWMEQSNFNELFPYQVFNESHNLSGFVVASKQEKKKDKQLLTYVNIVANSHMLLIGGTGSGKTQSLVVPTIQSNCFSSEQPTMIISDVKGELFKTQSLLLQKQGYDIQTLNLRDVKNSLSWNPLTIVYEKWYQSRTINMLKKECNNLSTIETTEVLCFKHTIINCQACINKITKIYWIYEKIWFYDNDQIDNYLQQQQQFALHQDMRNELKDITIALYSDNKNNNDNFWIINARKLFKAIVLAMLEDLEKFLTNNKCLTSEEEIKLINNFLPLQKFNIASVATIISHEQEMLDWLRQRNNKSLAKIAASSTLSSTGGQLSGILASASSCLDLFEEPLIQNITCQNNINFHNLTSKPTALFIIIPDERTENHQLASLFISQVYKGLIFSANQQIKQRLIRPVYFILDEFANMPAINNFESMITVSRSRNIFFQLIIQDFQQLENKYNKSLASIIFTNCATHIFLQTMNLETAKKYSEMIGQKRMIKVSVSGKGKNQSSSASLDQENLITANELISLASNQAVVVSSQNLPAKVNLIPWYQVTPNYTGVIKNQTNQPLVDFMSSYYYEFNKLRKAKENKKQEQPDSSKLVNLKQILLQYEAKENLTLLEKEMKQTLINEIKQLENNSQEGNHATVFNDNNNN